MNIQKRTIIKKIGILFLWLFASIGFVFTGIFIAMQFDLLNVAGAAKERDTYFRVPESVFKMTHQEEATDIHPLLTSLSWMNSSDWKLLEEVFTRDQAVITQAAHDAGIAPRILLGGVIGEQLRFFAGNRESFKQYFEPLKILGSLSKFSFGIAGLKPATVANIELYLKDTKSPFYLGKDMEHVADYLIPVGQDESTFDFDTARMARITNAKDPYYSYLYVGLYMREVSKQWELAGYPVDDRPEILATLYNLGFNRSLPKPDPQPGGALITIDGREYTFGQIAYEFYYSDVLSQLYPRTVQ